ncbi:MAG: hypothetical protein NXH85_02165 [Pseudomonadaceae bacterium]|nr:hypothetical protein [Pseudomonadaceae bacterium]
MSRRAEQLRKTQKSPYKLLRMVLMATLALGFGLYWLTDSFEIDRAELLSYAGASAGFVLALALVAVVAGSLMAWIRRRR